MEKRRLRCTGGVLLLSIKHWDLFFLNSGTPWASSLCYLVSICWGLVDAAAFFSLIFFETSF